MLINTGSFKERVRSNQVLLGAGVTAGLLNADVILRCRPDWLFIDMESLPLSIAEVSHILDLSSRESVPTLVRLNDHNPAIIRQVLDAGANGIIAPMVSNEKQAHTIVQTAYYPPEGRRGLASAKIQGYTGGWDQGRLLEENRTICVILMIENQEGLDNLERIAAVSGVDGLFVGTGDLKASLGILGDPDSSLFDEALVRVGEACKRHGIAAGGMVVNRTSYAQFRALDFSLLLAGLDLAWLQQAARQHLDDLKRWESM